MIQSFPQYALEVVTDIMLGLTLGVSIDTLVTYIGLYFNLSQIAMVFLQLALIIIVLYVMKRWSKYLYNSWYADTDYGIIFIAVFIESQRNIVTFIEDIHNK